MKKIFTILLFLSFIFTFGQMNIMEKENYVVKIISGNKSSNGYFFQFAMTKENTSYTAIVIKKNEIDLTSSEITFHFNKQPDNSNYILKFPVESNYIIEQPNNNLMLIPFWKINRMLNAENVQINYDVLSEDEINDLKIPLDQDQILRIKKYWEWEINEILSRK